MELGFFIDNETGAIEPRFENGDYLEDGTLETAIILSLFSDRRVDVSELPAGDTRRRGFWGDMYSEVPGDKYGSKLWTLERAKLSDKMLPLVEAKAKEALTWMIEDGAAKAIAIEAALENGKLKLAITITKPDNDRNRYGFIWNEQEIRRA